MAAPEGIDVYFDNVGGDMLEVGSYFKAGKVKHKETVVEGIAKAADALLGLFQGQNVGKMVELT